MDESSRQQTETDAERCEDQMLKVVDMRRKYGKTCVAYVAKTLNCDNKVFERKLELLKQYKFAKSSPSSRIAAGDESLAVLFQKVRAADDAYTRKALSMEKKTEAIREVLTSMEKNRENKKHKKLFEKIDI